MQSLFSKITRVVTLSRRFYLHHPRGELYSIHPREVGSWREHLPTQTWSSRFICVKAPNVPEGEPLPESVPVPVPVPVQVPVQVQVQVQVPVPEPVPVCVTETVHKAKSDPDPVVKGGADLWDTVYSILQMLATILAIVTALFTIPGYIKKLSGGDKKKFEELSRKHDLLILVMLLQCQISEQMLKTMNADLKAKRESWLFKLFGYK